MSTNAREIEAEITRKLGPNYDKTKKPYVYFFDTAIEDQELTAESGRPRFRNVVYISKKSPTSVTRQEHHRIATDEDRAEWPDEWAYYKQVHENRMKARISQLPGIDEATKAEMRALEIYNFEQLIEQEHFAPWKQMARRILNAIENREERRQDLPGHPQIQPVRVLAGDRGRAEGRNGPGRIAGQAGQEKDGSQESRQKDNRVIIPEWSFEVTL